MKTIYDYLYKNVPLALQFKQTEESTTKLTTKLISKINLFIRNIVI